MLILAGIALLVLASVALLATWNAARPAFDPTRRYTRAWLPAMVVGELAPFWLLVHVVLIAIAVLLGADGSVVGMIGLAFLVASTVLLVWLIVQARIALGRLRPHITGPVHPASGRARLVGRPVQMPSAVTERHGVAWHDDLTADLTLPARMDTAVPVVVYVHGGGWTGGDPQRQARDLYHALALEGWATVAIRYPFTPTVSVEHQVEIVRSAVRWARSGLSGHGVNASTVAIAGGSAGAHLAAMAAFTATCQAEEVAACVGLYGVYDMANRNRTRATWTKIPNVVMCATVDEAPERYAALSPLDQIHHATPPVLLVHGTRDTLVPIGEALQFAGALREAGRPVTAVPVLGAEHAYDGVSSPRSRAAAAVVRDWLVRTV